MVGDVVLTRVPYTDLTGSKIRPVLVLADVGMDDWIACQITTNPQVRSGSVAIARRDMAVGGLRFDSWARTNRLFTLNDKLFRRTLGRISDAKQVEITSAVRSLF